MAVTNSLQNTNQTGLRAKAKQSVGAIINSMLDSSALRNRFNELLGKRTPQFISSLIAVINADANLTKALNEAPMTVIQAGLKAASYDLPIDSSLGYAYIVPFNNKVKDEYGNDKYQMEATFIIGYKGLVQLALRTGEYERINVTDIREGEFKSRDRLSGDVEFEFIDDDDEREKHPIVGYAAYYRLKTGMSNMLYSTVAEITQHEIKFRKGKFQGKGWRENPEIMSKKTVLRELLGKWGILSIDYRSASTATQDLISATTGDQDTENILGTAADNTDEAPIIEGVVSGVEQVSSADPQPQKVANSSRAMKKAADSGTQSDFFGAK